MRAGCISANCDAENPAVPANEAAAGAKARGEMAAAEEAGEEALDVSACLGDEEAEGWLEKKEPTLLVPIGGDCMAAESIGRERRAASEAGR
jgi:hypothetical protein